MRPPVVLVKLGGSLITEKSREETVRPEVLSRLAGEIARAAAKIPDRIIVGHGSGSFGHVAASRSGIAGGLRSADQLPGVSLTQDRAAALHRHVIAALLAAGACPFSIAPSSAVTASGGKPVTLVDEPLLLALERGLLPVLYGDVVMDRDWGVSIASTEKLFDLLVRNLLAHGYAVRRVLWLGETDGLWDEERRTIPRVSAGSFAEAVKAIGAPSGTDVTGGMLHRLESALALARLGVPSLLANGLTPGLLESALRGDEVPGTEVV
ncbi:MAG TPA: isopentenyl phosphate kinase [Thermoanaerobaculia bacterium]|nr:isopentenyl phosphate kinase [Thermoanaerobaculia bacterium]